MQSKMKNKRTLLLSTLSLAIILAVILLILTLKQPSNNTNALPDESLTSSPTATPEPVAEVTVTPTEAPIQTVTPKYSQNIVNPKDVNPDILPVYDGDNAFTEYAKEKKFGDIVFKFWHFLDFDIVTSNVENPHISFGPAESYTDVEGVTTFRGNHYRNSAAYGSRKVTEKKLELVWTKDIGSATTDNSYWPGVGWTGQPLIIHWDEDVRKLMNIKPELKDTDLVEVIYPTLDGNIYFLNLEDGQPTRDPINIGYSTKGTGMIDPRGYPILYTGQGLNQNGSNYAHHKFRIFSLIDQSELFSITGTTPESFRLWGAFDPSPLVDKETDTLIQPGENGLLYRIKLNTNFNKETGELSINPEVTKYRYQGVYSDYIGFENSPVFYKNYLYLADNGGLLQCIDINTLEPVWIANVEDDTDATMVLEETDEGVFLYTGNEVDIRATSSAPYADCQLRKFNALTGELIWEKSYRCIYQNGVNGGLLSTPVLGKNDISDIVIFNICKTTNWQSGKMVALDKKTGEEVWVKDLANYSWSSPVDFQSDDGKTYMIFCDYAGQMHLMDPANGEILDTISVGLNVEASPAIYNDMVVVGTYAKKIYGVRIK